MKLKRFLALHVVASAFAGAIIQVTVLNTAENKLAAPDRPMHISFRGADYFVSEVVFGLYWYSIASFVLLIGIGLIASLVRARKGSVRQGY